MRCNELAHRLATEGFRGDSYSLDGGLPPLLEGYILRGSGRRWTIEYYERGVTRTLSEYSAEEEACQGMYETLKEDPTTRDV